jgi:transcriptional regulator with XRE-family HTH domain
MVIYEPGTLKALRRQRRLRVEDLAAKARVSPRQVHYIEHGSIPKADTLAKLATALGVPVQAFFSGRRA